MRLGTWLPKAQQAAFCLLAFTIPLPFQFASLASILVAVLWLPDAFKRSTWQQLRRSPVLLLWPLLYGLHAVSYFYSIDKGDSLFDLESKLSFLLLPLALGANGTTGRKELEQILVAFIAGLSAVAAGCLGKAAYDLVWLGERGGFFYHALVDGLTANAVYMAWYVLTALSALLLCHWTYVFQRNRLWYWVQVVLLSVFFVLLSSKTLLLFWAVLVVPLFLYRFRMAGGISRGGVLIAGLALVVAVVSLAATDNPVRRRYDGMLKNDLGLAFLPSYRDTVAPFNNLTLRLFIWRVGVENVRAERRWLFGAGNGSVHPLQNRRFDALGIRDIYNREAPSPLRNVNLHNMFLQIWLMIGLPGLLLLLVLVVAPVFAAWKMPDREFFFLHSAAGLLFLFQEAALQTQAGIIFFVFFNSLFWQQFRNRAAPVVLPVNSV